MHRLVFMAGCLLIACGCKPPASTAPGTAPPQESPAGGLVPATAAGDSTAQPAQPQSPPSSPQQSATAAIAVAAQPDEPLPDDPLELARAALAAQTERVRLISSITDIESAKAVAGTY